MQPCFVFSQKSKAGSAMGIAIQEVLNPTPLNPTPATCHKRKRKLRCNFWNAALQKLHCNIGFSAMRTSFVPKVALQQTKNCTATSKSLRCRKVALSWRFPAGFKPPRLGTHVSDLLSNRKSQKSLRFRCAEEWDLWPWANVRTTPPKQNLFRNKICLGPLYLSGLSPRLRHCRRTSTPRSSWCPKGLEDPEDVFRTN